MTEGKVEGLLFKLPLKRELPDFAALARAIIPGKPTPSGGRYPAFDVHLEKLWREFAGAPQLDFYHAVLNVLLRRGIESDIAYTHFAALWRDQHAHLLRSLNARWLVSACDTIMDFGDETERARSLVGSTLMNTIKLYETERLALGKPAATFEQAPKPLFDGMTTFSAGVGDMIFNLRARSRAICADTTAGRIVQELLRRADRADTIFRRLAEVHTDDATRWV